MSGIIVDMEPRHVEALFSRLMLDLDSPDPTVVGSALTQFGVMVPRLNLDVCLTDARLRVLLRQLPDRLLQALGENLTISKSAKAAALALVAAMYPAHYREQVRADEAVARADLERIFETNDVQSFLTVHTNASDAVSALEARIWTGMPFELAGDKPNLMPSETLSRDGEFDLEVAGAKVIDIENVAKPELADGQFAGLRVTMAPDEATAVDGKIVVYIKKDDTIYCREVFDPQVLFPNVSTDKAPASKEQAAGRASVPNVD